MARRKGDRARRGKAPRAENPVQKDRLFGDIPLIPVTRTDGKGKTHTGFEYDLETGCHPGDPNVRLTPVKVAVRNGQIFVAVPTEAE